MKCKPPHIAILLATYCRHRKLARNKIAKNLPAKNNFQPVRFKIDLLSYLGLAKLVFERCAESKYSTEKSTLASYSRSCCFKNERLDELCKEFDVDNYPFLPPAYDPVEWGWELTGFSIGMIIWWHLNLNLNQSGVRGRKP